MKHTWDRTERQAQKVILRETYPDYDPRHHDVWVRQYNEDIEREAMAAYHEARGIA